MMSKRNVIEGDGGEAWGGERGKEVAGMIEFVNVNSNVIPVWLEGNVNVTRGELWLGWKEMCSFP